MGFIPFTDLVQYKNDKNSAKIAKVINNLDPLNKGRIKVSLPGIFDPVDEEGSNLRWIHQYRTSASEGMQSFDIPCVGDSVYVIWPYNDQIACYKGMDYGEETDNVSFGLNYPYDSGISCGDLVVKMDSGSNFVEISSKKGQFTIRAGTTGIITIEGGQININSSHAMNIKAPLVGISGDVRVDGQLSVTSAASGAISFYNTATVANGVVTAIS